MKLVSFREGARLRAGRIGAAGEILPFAGCDMQHLIEARAGGADWPATEPPLAAAVQLLAPLPRPRRNVFCVGLNYRSHAAELAARGFNGARSADDLIPQAPAAAVAEGAGTAGVQGELETDTEEPAAATAAGAHHAAAGRRAAWPSSLPEQIRLVADTVAAAPQGLDLDQLAAQFSGRGPWKKRLPDIVDSLAALGRVKAERVGERLVWRG